MSTLGRALVFFGLAGLATHGVYAFMGGFDDQSVYHAAFSGFLIVLGAALLFVGRRRRPLPEGYALVARDLALPMGGWTVVQSRGWTDGDFALTAASLPQPVPDITSDADLEAYAASVAQKMSGTLTGHRRATLQGGTEVISMTMVLAATNCAQTVVPRGANTQVVAVTHPDPTSAAERGEWALAHLIDLRA